MGKSLAEWQKAGHETGSIVADPLFVDVSVQNQGDSILVTEETAATGKRSVKITGAPGLQHTWMPAITALKLDR